jgi:hypothetical protein
VDRREHHTRKAKNYYLQEVARYPRDTTCIRTALTRLADELDPADSLRYYQLIKGLRLARYLYRQTVDEWVRQDTFNQAVMSKAEVAIVEYHRAYTSGERRYFYDADLMDYALLLLIVYDSIRAPKILNEVNDTLDLRYNYLYGQYYLKKNDIDNAADHFRLAVTQESDTDITLRLLSAINLAELLDSLGDNDGALDVLDTIIARENFYLREDYPRFRTLKDTCWADSKSCPCLADDALYKRGLIYYKRSEIPDGDDQEREYKELIMNAVGSLNEVIKLYYKFEYFEKSKVKIKEIMKQYNQEKK